MLGLLSFAVHLDAARPVEAAFALHDLSALFLVALYFSRAVEVADYVVAVVEAIFEIQGGGALGPRRFVADFGRPDQGLRRDACPVGAFAPQKLFLYHCDLLAGGEQATGYHLPSWTQSENYRVELFSHLLTSLSSRFAAAHPKPNL